MACSDDLLIAQPWHAPSPHAIEASKETWHERTPSRVMAATSFNIGNGPQAKTTGLV